MSRAIKALSLCLLLCVCLVVPTLAAEPETLPGWDAWDTSDYGSHAVMNSPDKNCTDADILADVSRLIAANQGVIGTDYRQFQMIYTYTRQANTLAGIVNFMTQKVIPSIGGLWPCPDSYADVSVTVGKTNSEYTLCVIVDMNGGSEETTALYRKIKEVGDAAIALADADAGRLGYISTWLSANTEYQSTGAPHENEAYGAIVEGRAVCGGYTEAVTLLCRYLGVPSTTIRNSSHIWNCVFIDGKWKHWDATWADGNGQGQYFLVDSISDDTNAHAYEPEVLAQAQAAALENTQYYTAPAKLYRAAITLNQAGVLHGNGNGLALNAPLTRAQLAVILARLYSPDAESAVSLGSYEDAPQWAAASIEWCVREGYLLPAGNLAFGAKDTVTLSELAAAFGISAPERDGAAIRADMILPAVSAV